MADPRAGGWQAVLDDHASTAARFAATLRRLSPDVWQLPQPGREWSPAEEAVHVALSYEIGLATLTRGAGMQPRVSVQRARLLRWAVLPVILRTNWFPRASAPAEVRPAEAEARDATIESTAARVERLAAAIGAAAMDADPGLRVQHAYFGRLAPQTAIRLLAAHTRHHTRTLARQA